MPVIIIHPIQIGIGYDFEYLIYSTNILDPKVVCLWDFITLWRLARFG